jgi:hypothetical protein
MDLTGSGNPIMANCCESRNEASCSIEVMRYLTGLLITILQEKSCPWGELE